MVQLKEKTVEELRKMASRKKIEGRSKMNKSQLLRALNKKMRIMKGGYLNEAELQIILNPTTRPRLFKYMKITPVELIDVSRKGDSLDITRNTPLGPEKVLIPIEKLFIIREGNNSILHYSPFVNPPTYATYAPPVPSLLNRAEIKTFINSQARNIGIPRHTNARNPIQEIDNNFYILQMCLDKMNAIDENAHTQSLSTAEKFIILQKINGTFVYFEGGGTNNSSGTLNFEARKQMLSMIINRWNELKILATQNNTLDRLYDYVHKNTNLTGCINNRVEQLNNLLYTESILGVIQQNSSSNSDLRTIGMSFKESIGKNRSNDNVIGSFINSIMTYYKDMIIKGSLSREKLTRSYFEGTVRQALNDPSLVDRYLPRIIQMANDDLGMFNNRNTIYANILA